MNLNNVTFGNKHSMQDHTISTVSPSGPGIQITSFVVYAAGYAKKCYEAMRGNDANIVTGGDPCG